MNYNRKFEWDEEKNKSNKMKHFVSFEEASTVFRDDFAIKFYDKEHSEYEERFIIIGISEKLHELHVCHCYRGKNEEIVRIISARKATKNEIRNYWEARGL